MSVEKVIGCVWVAGFLMVTAIGCGPSGNYVWGRAYTSAAEHTAGAIIRPGDKVSVRVFGQDPMSITGTVTPGGALTIPLLGEYPVVGKTPAAVAKELEARLTPFVTAPHVIVVLDEYKVRVTALGELRRNGRLVLDPPATLIEGLAEAGGLTEFANASSIFVLRGDQRIRFTFEEVAQGLASARNFYLREGDVIVAE